MKCLITGGAGFIGSHLAEELVRQKHQISVFYHIDKPSLHPITGAFVLLHFLHFFNWKLT